MRPRPFRHGTTPRRNPRRPAGRRTPVVEALEGRQLLALALQVDYSLDSSGFFTPDRRTLLEQTLGAIVARLGDTLSAVQSASYTVPFGAASQQVTTGVAANSLKLYAYGAPLLGSTAGLGGSYWTSSDTMRGQAANNDFAPDLSYIQFDNDGTTNWFFGSASAGLDGNEIDFVSVARHEFLHALGFLGAQPGLTRYLQGSTFAGPNALAARGGAGVPLTPDHGHIADSVPSIMNPVTLGGRREDLRDLEWAMLKDFGWSVAAQPNAPGFDRSRDLFLGGDGEGTATVKVAPSRGVHLMRVDALAGDTLRLRTRDGSLAGERGVDSYLKIFDNTGRLLLTNDNSSTAAGKEDTTFNFPTGGTYWVGASTYPQRDYTFTTPSATSAPSTAFYLEATLTGRPDADPDNINGATAALAFTDNRSTRQATLDGPDQDYFRLDAQAGHSYTIETSPPAGGGLSGPATVALYDPTGRKLAGADGSTPSNRLSFTPALTTTYFVRVAATAGATQIGPGATVVRTPWSLASPDGEFTASGNRDGGSDYVLSILDQPPAPSPGPDPGTTPPGSEGPTPPPVGVLAATPQAARRRLASVELRFTGPLDPVSAGLPGTYLLVGAGRDRRFGTRDDLRYRIKLAAYDSTTNTVRLTPKRKISGRGRGLQVRATGLRDAQGRPLGGGLLAVPITG